MASDDDIIKKGKGKKQKKIKIPKGSKFSDPMKGIKQRAASPNADSARLGSNKSSPGSVTPRVSNQSPTKTVKVSVPSGASAPDPTKDIKQRAARADVNAARPGAFSNASISKPSVSEKSPSKKVKVSIPSGTGAPKNDPFSRITKSKPPKVSKSIPVPSSAQLSDITVKQSAMRSESIDVKVPTGTAGPNPIDEAVAQTRQKAEPDSKVSINTQMDKKFAFSTRYRVPKKLANTSKKKLRELSELILDQISRHDTSRQAKIEQIRTFRESWRNFESAGLNLQIDGQHDEHIPLIFEKGKAMHSRIYQAIYKIEPLFALKPRTQVSEKQKQEKQDLLNYVIMDYMNEGNGILDEGDRDVHNFVFDGTSITKHGWKRDVRKYVEVETELAQPITLDETGQPVMTEIEKEVEKIVYDGPTMKARPLEAVRIIGPRAETIDDADMVCDEFEFTKSELVKLSRLGFFMSNSIDRVLSRSQPHNQANFSGTGSDQSLRKQAERLSGLNQDQEGKDTYRFFESYLSWDIDGDGIDEELVVWVEEQSKTICRMTYLDRVSPNGKRPFVLKKFIPVEGSPYGIGMAELLFGINNLLDYVANQRLDAGTFQTFPWFFYTAASGIDAGDIVIGPGKGVPVDDPSQVVFPRVNGTVSYGFNEESLVTKYAERVSSITEFAQGMTGGQGIARTATGAAGLIQEVNTNLDIYIQRYQREFKKNLRFIDKQTQELLPLGMQFAIQGPNNNIINKRFKDRDSIKWDTDFDLTGNSVNSNKAIERDTATQILQMQLNPIMLQSGLVGPVQLYNGVKNALQKMEVRDVGSYLIQPEEAKGSQFDAKDELNMIVAGVKPQVQINDKHAEKLAFFEQFEASDEFGFLTEEHLPLYMEVKQAHAQFAQSIAAQAPLAANSGGAVDPALASQVLGAAGSGNPQGGVPNQITDLLPDSSTLAE